MHDALSGKAGETYQEYTPEQRAEIQEQVKQTMSHMSVDIKSLSM